MFFQKDYVLRMIEMMGELVRRICSIAREADAMAELDEISQRACGLPMTMLRNGEIEQLSDTLDEAQRFLAAELLAIAIEIEKRTHTEDDLLPLHEQATALYATLHEPDYMLPASDRVALLVDEHLHALSSKALLSAGSLLERADQFAKAEDALYAAMELDAAAKEAILSFYARLEVLDDATLAAGGLPRSEIAESRIALSDPS